MSRGLGIWALLACAHLLLSIGGAIDLPMDRGTAAGAAITHYGFMTGADAGFSFFAPSVASLSRVSFTLRDAEGRTWQDTVFGDAGTTWGLRSSAVFDCLADLEDRMLRGVTGSWAALLLGRNPQAVEVVVDVEIEELPTMAQWREGQRSRWLEVYRGTFQRNADPVAAEHER